MERKTKIILSVLSVFLILYGLFLTLEVKYDKLETEYSGIKIDDDGGHTYFSAYEDYFKILQKYEVDCNFQNTSDNLQEDYIDDVRYYFGENKEIHFLCVENEVKYFFLEKEVLYNHKEYFLEFLDDTEYNKLNGFSLNIEGLLENDYSLLGYLI